VSAERSGAALNVARAERTSLDEETTATLLDALRGVVGDAHVLVDADLRASYETDWSRRWSGRALAVVRPGTTEQVSDALRLCHRYNVACVPQGGRTGLVGGSVPANGEIVLAMERLNHIGSLDADAGRVTVGAGVTLAALYEVAAAAGWRFGVDLASRESATMGGMIATNAGGVRVVRHGQMREQVISLEVVLADGTVLRGTGDALKDNAGYDLAQIIIGSEGTLGVVTSARLQLVAPDAASVVAFLGVRDIATALEVVARLRRSSGVLTAAEFMDHAAVERVCEALGATCPVIEAPWYALIEVAGDGDPTEVVAHVLADCPGVNDDAVAVGSDSASNRRLWRFREGITESIARAGVAHKLDVGVDPATLDVFAREVRERARLSSPKCAVVLFGHLSEGNVHVNVLGVEPGEEGIDDAVLRLVAEMGGNVAAEHGVGRAKVAWLHLSRTPEEIRTMRALKFALDPAGILNPGVMLP
jgi:FAD/FMN-containing dehydrogenase